MAITTLDGVISGALPPAEHGKAVTGTLVVGRAHSTLFMTGIPGAAVAPSVGLSGVALSAGFAGQIPFTNPPAGQNTYLSRFQGMSTAAAGTLLLCDRLWHNSGILITQGTYQSFLSAGTPVLPPRDSYETSAGDGVYAGLEFYAAGGLNAPVVNIEYINSSGFTSSGTNTIATAASPILGSFYQMSLSATDKGVQQINGIRFTGTPWASGTVGMVLYRILARLELAAGVPNAMDALTSGFPRIYNNTCPFLLFIPGGTTTTNIQAQVIWTQG